MFAPRRLPRRQSLIALCLSFLIPFALLTAEEAQAEEALPDYVIEAFGEPPPIPDGPLPDDLAEALRIVFIDSMEQQVWASPQNEALEVIAASGDPRLAWAIADMMRFTWQPC